MYFVIDVAEELKLNYVVCSINWEKQNKLKLFYQKDCFFIFYNYFALDVSSITIKPIIFMDFQKYLDQLYSLLTTYAPKIVGATLAWIVGIWIVHRLSDLLQKSLVKSNFDLSISRFLINLISIGLRILLLFSIAGILGIETTSFIAVLGAMGLAVGLALQGSLSNFAGSVLILFFKPYKVGDIITSQGFTGTVREIQTFNTVLETPDNQIIILPNGSVANGAMVNLSGNPTRRVDFKFKVSSKNDSKKVRDIVLVVAGAEPLFLKDPACNAVVSGFEDNAYYVTLMCWMTSADFVASYWDVLANINDQVQASFIKENIAAPSQDRQVYLHNEK